MTQEGGSWIHTPGGRLHVQTWMASGHRSASAAGTGEARDPGVPIVLFHDSLGCVELWRGFPAALAHVCGRRVIAYDRLGFGRSDPHPGRLAVDFIGEESRTGFAELRRQLGFDRFIAFGHSVGGGMAVHCAARYPGRCEAVITVAAQASVEERTLQGIRAAQADFARPGQLDRLERYHGDKAAWVLEAWTGTWLSPAFRHWSLAGDGVRVPCPLLAVHGAEDEFGSPAQAAAVAALADGRAEVAILPGCRHLPHRERADEVLSRVAAFLAGARMMGYPNPGRLPCP